jgi:LacI family transcriptional regulator
LCTTNNDLVEQKKYIDLLLQRKVDGFIFASVHYRDPSIQHILSNKLPHFLYYRRTIDSNKCNYVVLDNELGVFLAIEHLYKLGHRRISLIRGTHSFSTGRERFSGYQKALKHFGLPYDKSIVFQGDYSKIKAMEVTMKLISSDFPPSAILVSSDIMALGVLEALHVSGKRIPEDFSVVGFDDIDISSHSKIQLTTVSQNQNLMAKIAFDNLWRILQEPNVQQPIQVVLKALSEKPPVKYFQPSILSINSKLNNK